MQLEPLPSAVEIEQEILARLLIFPESCAETFPLLTTADFYKSAHQIIFTSIGKLWNKNETVSLTAVVQELRDKKSLGKAGGAVYLSKLIDTVPTAQDIPGHAKTLRLKAAHRAAITTACQLENACKDGSGDIFKILNRAKNELADIEIGVLDDDGLNNGTGFNAEELLNMKLPEAKWAVPGILPEGLTILGGKPKMGKSILCLNLCIAIASGGKAFGHIDVEAGPVLYLALEDTKRRLQTRIKAMLQNGSAPENLHLETEWAKMGDGGLTALDRKIKAIKPRLVIIDTLKMIRPAQKNQNPYDIDYENIAALKALADDNGVSILIVHHLRKTASDDVMDDFSGTFGLTGAADGLIAFKRKTGQSDAELHLVGRDVDAAEYAMKYHPDLWMWEMVGDATEVKSTAARQLVFDTLKNADGPLKANEITSLTDLKYRTVRANLTALICDGSIEKAAKYGAYQTRGRGI